MENKELIIKFIESYYDFLEDYNGLYEVSKTDIAEVLNQMEKENEPYFILLLAKLKGGK